MVDEKKLELMKKLQALAERGVGGEKAGAQQKLQELMDKYNITEADLSEDKLENYDFRYKTEWEAWLLCQLFFKIAPDRRKYTYRYGRGSKSTYGITCTKAEELQLRVEYDFYRALWKEEQEFFFRAFIQKHRIFGIRKDGGGTTLSDEDWMRMQAMMSGMQNKQMQMMLEDNEKKEY